jgi:hypothetical protein
MRKSNSKKERSKKIKPNSKPHTIMMATWWKIRSQGRGKKLKGGRVVFVEGIENNYRIFRLLPKSVTVTIWLVYITFNSSGASRAFLNRDRIVICSNCCSHVFTSP